MPQAPGNPVPHQAFGPGNGVPHPPVANNGPAAIGNARAAETPSPAWMQPHAPMERQRPAPPTALHAAGQNALPPVRSAAVPHPEGVPTPQGAQPGSRNEAPRALPQPRLDSTAQIPQPRPRPDFQSPAQHGQSQPERAAPAPQPHAEFAQPAPHREIAPPRVNEYHPPAPPCMTCRARNRRRRAWTLGRNLHRVWSRDRSRRHAWNRVRRCPLRTWNRGRNRRRTSRHLTRATRRRKAVTKSGIASKRRKRETKWPDRDQPVGPFWARRDASRAPRLARSDRHRCGQRLMVAVADEREIGRLDLFQPLGRVDARLRVFRHALGNLEPRAS